MLLHATFCLILSVLLFPNSSAISSPIQPYTSYRYSTELQSNVADLWWTVNETKQEIIFELHMKTTGWIALGISPAGGMKGADIGLGWVDQKGQVHFQDRYAKNYTRPIVDTTTSDWFGLQGREENGWTAIQFKRLLDTCDTMDVPIKSGTNILIFAYGLEDPDMSEPQGIIYYHDNRRGSRIIPLRSYGNPSPEDKFAGLDYFDFQLNNYNVPVDSTTYHCKVYKVPSNLTERRHAIAHKTIIGEGNIDIVHHLLMYECNPTAVFDDNNLPDGLCDAIYQQLTECSANIATGWAVGGDHIVEFPEIAGYPVGGDFEIKYYMIQMHYDNPKQLSNRRDNSGIRFYLGKELRQEELGYLTLGADSTPVSIAIPPRSDRFVIDSYCTASATKVIPKSGITVTTAFPHTHLQGRTVWTKIIRNGTAVDYLFNGDAYDFNYQFENRLPKPVKLYPGDELATRCVYNTMDKNQTTTGGERTQDEMCLHMFTYYPRMKNMYGCMMLIPDAIWAQKMNISQESFDYLKLKKWLVDLQWTPESVLQWQEFYNDASRLLLSGRAGNFTIDLLPRLPTYKDLQPAECKSDARPNTAAHQHAFTTFTLIPFFIIFAMNMFARK
ncbi:unnamed protein product [Adineta ricciae]|uniref:DOMON domain-containing protein n=1 Tax=Adineta ricciae TaxID=249248 RepID=A0A814DFL2_ADIRI|nr:unnamed protein product [Adineta ricciae]CAF1155209.1 unnamed protein product [Adineta ricciae]